VNDLKLRIRTETSIPVNMQELLCSTGEELDGRTLVKDYAGEHVRKFHT